MGNGQIQSEQLDLLQFVEAWMSVHAQSIVGTQPGLEPWQFYGPSTRRGSLLPTLADEALRFSNRKRYTH
jgi:alpha-L-fucosidase